MVYLMMWAARVAVLCLGLEMQASPPLGWYGAVLCLGAAVAIVPTRVRPDSEWAAVGALVLLTWQGAVSLRLLGVPAPRRRESGPTQKAAEAPPRVHRASQRLSDQRRLPGHGPPRRR